ncbi:DUF5131 family protein [Euryhalocaulis caribicus]|uniref:DUF5131 family protein n=1 Tax=Euryhalocaulis caribicus TaxID=1161401 RepID=UPI0003A73886|nr:phage Gp37/Gp68 family protein [Euryhalocaulis caribicus]
MAESSSIEWTDATWNIVTGCDVVSPGCTNCYAMKLAGTRLRSHPSRKGLTRPSKAGPVWTGEVRFNEDWLDQPLLWKRPRMIFVAAHGDLFHEGVTDAQLDRVFAVMAVCPEHTFQVLTKRPERMRDYFAAGPWLRWLPHMQSMGSRRKWAELGEREGGLPNVWLGVSAEDQKRADERIPALLATPAAVRFVSAEPLLGPVDLGLGRGWCRACGTLTQGTLDGHCMDPSSPCFEGETFLDAMLHWVICGGESGPDARPMHPDWARGLRDQCAANGVAFHFKQWGAWAPVEVNGGMFMDASGNRFAELSQAAEKYQDIHGRLPDGSEYWRVWGFDRVGKKAAGRLLDGRTHDGIPSMEARP